MLGNENPSGPHSCVLDGQVSHGILHPDMCLAFPATRCLHLYLTSFSFGSIAAFTCLETLCLTYVSMEDRAVSGVFKALANLSTLCLTEIFIADSTVSAVLEALASLSTLCLTDVDIEDSAVPAVSRALASLPNLTYLMMVSREGRAPLPIAEQLTGLTNLQIGTELWRATGEG